jgi:type IX secretion system PorP/SprF family membrane protein
VIVKRTLGFILGFSVCWGSYGQDYHFSGFMQNLVYVNPAYAALPSSAEFGLTYRNQWPGIPATFVTYGAALVVPFKSINSGLGVCVVNDMQGSGVINSTSAGLLYGYRLKFGNNWQVGAGISASYVMKHFSADELVFRSDLLNDLGYSYGNVVYDNYSKNYPDFSVGLIANNNNLSFGISMAHVTRPEASLSNLIENRLPVKYTAFISGKLSGEGKRLVTPEPAVFYSYQHNNQEIIWGSAFLIGSNFMIGGWLRQNIKMSFEAFIISAGISWEKYNISYNYDVNLKKIDFLSTKMAAHEVTFLYRFEYKEKYKSGRGKKNSCPAYSELIIN